MRIDDFQELLSFVNDTYCNQDYRVEFDGKEIAYIETPTIGPIVCRMHLADGGCFNWRDCHVDAADITAIEGRLNVEERVFAAV